MQQNNVQFIVRQNNKLLVKLVDVLSGMVIAHRELLTHLEARREAMRSANFEFDLCHLIHFDCAYPISVTA